MLENPNEKAYVVGNGVAMIGTMIKKLQSLLMYGYHLMFMKMVWKSLDCKTKIIF